MVVLGTPHAGQGLGVFHKCWWANMQHNRCPVPCLLHDRPVSTVAVCCLDAHANTLELFLLWSDHSRTHLVKSSPALCPEPNPRPAPQTHPSTPMWAALWTAPKAFTLKIWPDASSPYTRRGIFTLETGLGAFAL